MLSVVSARLNLGYRSARVTNKTWPSSLSSWTRSYVCLAERGAQSLTAAKMSHLLRSQPLGTRLALLSLRPTPTSKLPILPFQSGIVARPSLGFTRAFSNPPDRFLIAAIRGIDEILRSRDPGNQGSVPFYRRRNAPMVKAGKALGNLAGHDRQQRSRAGLPKRSFFAALRELLEILEEDDQRAQPCWRAEERRRVLHFIRGYTDDAVKLQSFFRLGGSAVLAYVVYCLLERYEAPNYDGL